MMRWARVCTLAASIAALAGGTVSVRAQQASSSGSDAPITSAAAPPADAMFMDASAKETAVRKALADPGHQATVLKAVRTVVADYESLVRRYPNSSYCDDALWRAGRLSRDAFDLFRDPHERTTALRLLQQLTSQYPTSKLARLAPEQIAWLNGRAVSSPPASPSRPAPLHASADAETTTNSTVKPAPNAVVTVKAVRRAVLADVVRVVIEMDGEVPFHDERIENPTRVFVDLSSTRTAPGVSDQTLRFDGDTDIVRQIRIGRQPNGTTRVVLDAAGVSSYSVYPLYAPYRLVIDCLRASAAALPRTAAPSQKSSITPKPPAVLRSTPVTASISLPTTGAARLEPIAPQAPALRSRSAGWVATLPSGAAVVVSVAVTDAPVSTSSSLPFWAHPPVDAAKPPVPSTPATPPPAKPDPRGLSMARQLGLGVSRIVIDPGHGGHDPGAQGDGINEAELVLDIALRLEKLLKKAAGVEVALTRRNNDFVALQERTAIANRENADLFLSIHANANSVASARGIETYFLNFATNQTAAAVAARENATSDQTMGALQDVVKAIALNSKVDESRDFATYVQREMIDSLRPADKLVKDLGVKQAPFVVLVGASMPSVLAEISFITNPQDAKLLKTPAYRQRIAQALFDAVRKYQQSLKQSSSIAQHQD
jgi:N-acetylmuramoyl-L-alanine amidase